MEQQMDDTSKEFHLRLPKDLHQWFKDEANRQRRSANAEMLMALEAWRNSKEISVSDAKRLLLDD